VFVTRRKYAKPGLAYAQRVHNPMTMYWQLVLEAGYDLLYALCQEWDLLDEFEPPPEH